MHYRFMYSTNNRVQENSIDWADVSKLTCVTFTYHGSGPIYETLRYLSYQCSNIFITEFCKKLVEGWGAKIKEDKLLESLPFVSSKE